MADLLGQHLGPYELTALLGEGGMAAVYRAYQASMKRAVAVKVIKPGLVQMGDFVKRFEREAQTVASLSHPHILKVFDYGQHEDMVYLVMELQVGGSLAEQIRKGPLPLQTAAQILDQLAAALDYAHEHGIIHRDLKPQNVLLDEKGNAILTDFGLAKIINDVAVLTQSGLAMGTPAYMSPEQWQGRPLDARTDLYSLGIMLFEMLSGKLPFQADTPPTLMYMHLNEAPPPIRELRPDIPAGLEAVVDKALAKDPGQRFSSAGELASAFRAAIAAERTAAIRTRTPERPDTQLSRKTARRLDMDTIPEGTPVGSGGKRRAARLFAALVAALVVIVGAVLVVLSRGDQGSATTLSASVATGTQAVAILATPTPVPATVTTIFTPTPETRAAATNTAMVDVASISTPTSTQPSTATAAPTEKLTSTPVSASVANNMAVMFRDTFDANVLSDSWDVWAKRPVVENGSLLFKGDNAWGNGLSRGGIHENEGVLLLLQFEAGEMVLSLDSGDYNNSTFRSWGLYNDTNGWSAVSSSGRKGETFVDYGKAVEMRPGTWYYVLLFVGEHGRFSTCVWERDNPSSYRVNVSKAPEGTDWNNRTWTLTMQPYSGALIVDSYQELQVPIGFDIPGGQSPVDIASALTRSPRQAPPIILAFVPASPDPFYQVIQQGAEQAAADLGVQLVVRIPKQPDPPAQIKLIDALSDEPISALITAPIDPEQLIPSLEKAYTRGVPIITVDTSVGDGNYASGNVTFPLMHIGSPNQEGGHLACDQLAQAVGRQGKIYIQSLTPATSTSNARLKGCQDALAAYPDIRIVGVDYNGFDMGKAVLQLSNVLNREPDLAGIFTTTPFAIDEIGDSIIKAGKQDSLKLVTFDAYGSVIDKLRQGLVTFTVAQRPYDMGYLAVSYAVAKLSGVTSLPRWAVTGLNPLGSRDVDRPDLLRFLYDPGVRRAIKPLAAYTIGYVPGMAAPYFQKIGQGIGAAAQLVGANLAVQAPQQYTVDAQTTMIRAVMAGRIRSLIVAPTDPERMVPALEAVYQQGIPVISVDTFVGDGNYVDGPIKFPLAHIGTNHEMAGQIACEALAEAIGRKGLVSIMGGKQSPGAVGARVRGCQQTLAKYPAMTLMPVDNIADILPREKDLAGIVIATSPGTEGALKAISDAGKKGVIPVVAFDADTVNIENLKAGSLTLVIAQKPYDMGYLAVLAALANWRGVESVPKRIATDFVLINGQNVNDPDMLNLVYQAGAQP